MLFEHYWRLSAVVCLMSAKFWTRGGCEGWVNSERQGQGSRSVAVIINQKKWGGAVPPAQSSNWTMSCPCVASDDATFLESCEPVFLHVPRDPRHFQTPISGAIKQERREIRCELHQREAIVPQFTQTAVGQPCFQIALPACWFQWVGKSSSKKVYLRQFEGLSP